MDALGSTQPRDKGTDALIFKGQHETPVKDKTVTISNRLKTAVLATWTLVVTGTSVFVVYDHYATRDRLSRLDAVGGTDVYRKQRVEHLKRLKADAQRYVADPVVRAREIEALDRQIGEIANEGVDEIGAAATVERFK